VAEALTEIEEAYARLSMLEFAIEVIMANQLARADEESSRVTKEDFVRVAARSYGAMTGDLDTARRMQAIACRSAEMAERLVDKVARREKEIRARISPDP